jgi:hypothetical protein
VVLATAALPHGGAYLALVAAFALAFLLLYVTYVRNRFAGPLDPRG